jgi:glycerol-3-phosphate acyltransferase PlsY
LAVVWPHVLLPALAVWLLCLMWGGYVGLSTVLAGISVFLAGLVTGVDEVRLVFAALVGLFLVYTHRGNLARLRAGTEPRFERARVLGRLLSRKAT